MLCNIRCRSSCTFSSFIPRRIVNLRFGRMRRVVDSLHTASECVVSGVQYGQPDAAHRTCRLFSNASTSGTPPCFRFRAVSHAKPAVYTAPYRPESAYGLVVTVISRSRGSHLQVNPGSSLRSSRLAAKISCRGPFLLRKYPSYRGRCLFYWGNACQRKEPTS
jgi:hypothetical protein